MRVSGLMSNSSVGPHRCLFVGEACELAGLRLGVTRAWRLPRPAFGPHRPRGLAPTIALTALRASPGITSGLLTPLAGCSTHSPAYLAGLHERPLLTCSGRRFRRRVPGLAAGGSRPGGQPDRDSEAAATAGRRSPSVAEPLQTVRQPDTASPGRATPLPGRATDDGRRVSVRLVPAHGRRHVRPQPLAPVRRV